MKCPTASALNTHIVLKLKLHMLEEKGTVASSCESVKYLLETYAIENIFAETDAGMMLSIKPSNKFPPKYAEALSNQVLRCNRVHDEYVHKGSFIESLSE